MNNGAGFPVAIIGAGPAGLTAATLLARQGIGVTVLERHTGTSIHPRARGLNVRTMEIYRGLGLAHDIQEAGEALAASKYMLFVETLAGQEIRRVPDDDLVLTGDALAAITPCTWVQCAQDELEPLLLQAAQAAGAEIHFGTEVTHLAQDTQGVTLTTREAATGISTSTHAAYVIAADGAASTTRAALEVPLVERAVQGHYINIYFRADLRELIRGREFALCFVENDTAPGIILAVNNADRWLFNAEYDPAATTPAAFTPERCVDLIRAAVGISDLAVEILSILPWDATARYVSHMSVGRVFLAGDAAHTMPPAGGLGLNTGVADAHNLAWKLALVMQDQAAPTLLATYTAERLPVARTAVERAAAELAAERPDGPPEGEDAAPNAALIPILGFTYTSTAIMSEATPLVAGEGLDLTGRPGTRVPHVWLERAGQRISSLDLIGERFTLLTGPEGAVWGDAFRAAAEHLSLPLGITVIGERDGIIDANDVWCGANGVTKTGALLVRPDGVIAWRAAAADTLPLTEGRAILTRLLGRDQITQEDAASG